MGCDCCLVGVGCDASMKGDSKKESPFALTTWMSRWKLGTMVGKWVIYISYNPNIHSL